MDRGWHPTTFLGPERPRLGQQPYDRGRGISNDRRGCYECGLDGHIQRFCPQLDRYGDPGRLIERSTGNGNGRWGADPWLPPSRLTSSLGKEHSYSRTEAVRESSNSRRPYHDHHDGGDFTSRSRDSGDRHRDKGGKGGLGIAGLCNANATERDGKLGRSSSRKPADENHQVVGGHRGGERRDSKGRGGDRKSEELAASGEAPGQSPAKRVAAGGEDSRGQKAVQDDRPMSKSSSSGLELGQQDTTAGDGRASRASSRDGQWARHTTTGSEMEADGLVSRRDRCQATENGGNSDLECTADQAARSRFPNRRHSGGKLPLSVLCMDAAEGNLERKYRHEKPGLSSFSVFSGPVGNVRSSSDQKMDAEESRVETKAGTKLDSFLHQVKDDTANAKSIPVSDNGNHIENKCTKDIGRIGREDSERADARCDEKLGKGKRVSRWDGERGQADTGISDEDGKVNSRVEGSVSDRTKDAERILSSSAAEQDPKSKLADAILVDERKSIGENDKMLPLSEHATPDLVNGQGSVQERVDLSGGVERDLQLDRIANGDDCETREEEGEACEPDDYDDGIDDVTEREFIWQRYENVNSSCSGTPMRRNNLHYPQASFGSREGSVDGNWDKNGYSWNGRTGLKMEYRFRDWGGSAKNGGRNGFVNGSKFPHGDDDREQRFWGLDSRHARIWEAYPGHSQYRPGSYLAVCNARFLQLERRSPAAASPATSNVAVPSKRPAVPSSFMGEALDNETVEPRGSSWMYHDSQGILQGPVGLTATDLHGSGEVQSDGMVQREGSHSWALPELARSPVTSTLVASSVENKEPSVARSPRLAQVGLELHVPADEEEHVPEEHYNVENADQDICPPGTEAYGAKCSDDDHEDFHIDERVEKLMEGRPLIPGREKDVVHDVLSIAARLVLHEYELDFAVEESPRSHGGFAEMGDQWKDGDFGSDGQELEGFEFDQPVTKVDEAKAEVADVEVATNEVLEAASASEPNPRVNSVSHSHVESNQELWKWPSRGGDWKVTYVVDNSQHSKGEAQGPTEKGNTGCFKKMVMNEGRSLCGHRNPNLRDPRKQNKEGGRAPAEPMRLQLPRFAHKGFAPKPDISFEDHHLNHVQHSVPLLKGSNSLTPKSHSSTPNADVCTQGKDRSVVSGGTLKNGKSTKSSSTQGLGILGGGRSLNLVKQQQQPSSKGPKPISVAFNKESPPIVKSGSVVEKRLATGDKHGNSQMAMAASNTDSHYKPAPDFVVETLERKANQSLSNGLLDTPPSSDPQATNLEISRPASATPLKKLFLSRGLLSKENTDVREDHASANTPYKKAHSSALNEGPDVLPQTKKEEKSSIFFAHGGPLSPSLSVMPSGGGIARNSIVEKSRVTTGDTTPQHETHTSDHSTVHANSSLFGTPCDDSAGMMEVEGSDGPASISQDNSSADGECSRAKRKASSLDSNVKQHQKVLQKRRLLKKDCSGDLDKKPTHSSHEAGVNSFMPHLIDGYPARASSAGHIESRDRLEHRAQTWSSLEPGILRRIFRCLRGDKRTWMYATVATCTSWRDAARGKSKTDVKRAEPYLVRGRSLNGVIDSSASPMVHVSRKREDLHSKTKSLKVIGLRESSSRDNGESDVHATTDSASKAVSHDGYTYATSAVEEMTANDSTVDSSVTLSTPGLTADGLRHVKSNNGGAIVKPNGVSGATKFVRQENDGSVSHSHVKRKIVVGSSHKILGKSSYKPVTGGQRILADKHSSTIVKLEHHSKITSSSLFEGDKTLEKEIGAMIRLLMEVDTHKCFQTANYSTVDSKGVPVAAAAAAAAAAKAIDLLAIDKKYKSGAYAGGEKGLKAFKEDVNLMARSGFRNDKDTLAFSTAEKIFKLSHQHFNVLENLIAGTLPVDSNNQRKGLGPQPFNKAARGRLKNHHNHPGKKRKAWDINGLQKAKFGMVNKKGRTESSSGDLDSDSDSTEHEARRFSKSKKERRWDSEGESSEDDEDVPFQEEDEETTETEASGSDIPSESEGEDGVLEDETGDTDDEQQWGYHEWGARMTKASMVPPVTRKYVVVEDYKIVTDIDRVEQKMKVKLPEDFEEKRQAAKDKSTDSFSHLDIPEMRGYEPRKKLGEEILEQEVYGIDPYTHNLLYDTMPLDISGFSDLQKQQFIEERLLLALNKEVKQYTGSGKAPMEYHLNRVVERILLEADMDREWGLKDFCEQLLNNMRNRPKDKFVAYRKGLGVVCNKDNGLEKDEFVVEFFGEVYPPWRWYEKQDGIRSLQKKDKDTTPEFYNIFYERPKGDAAGYDLLVVDAMHKANFASRLCHSCRPNCEAKITAVNNTYIIGVYTLKPIQRGEELTFDYNSVTESKEEYNSAVCLCGSQGCKGSYLNLTGSGTYEEVILRHHGLLNRHRLLLESCTTTSMDKEWKEMRQAGLGPCLLSGLPPWAIKYAASLVHFMNFEKAHLPAELLRLKPGVMEEADAEITAEGVYNQRLQNLAITLDKLRYILTRLYKEPAAAPPPLRKLNHTDMVQWIWKRDDSVVRELLQCLAPHLSKEDLSELKLDIARHSPQDREDDLKRSLLWLRDELRRLPATCKARHDAAADLIHIYAHTKNFFTIEDYAVVESTPMDIHPLDLGSNRYSISGPRSWHKTYNREYVWGQLIGWYKQSVPDPGASLTKAARGCLTLPDVSSCYAKSMQHDFRLCYGIKHRGKMISHMEEKPQQKWPNSKIWSQFWCFKNERGLFGSPMLDSVLEGRALDDSMLLWLKSREVSFVGPWDEQ